MGTDSTTLKQAVSLVDEECSHLREERRAYEAFRERVSLALPDPSDATAPSTTTEEVLDAYRQKVMDMIDHESVYGDTLAESLEAELSPSVAQTLLSKKPFTQRRKRDLLVKTTAAIESREEFCAELDDERAALKRYAEELADIEEALEKLPACSPQEQHIEKLLVVWEVYDTLLEQCELLLDRRQKQIREAERSLSIFGKKHARNEFLYRELDTHYPVLSAIAATCDQIDARRHGEREAKPSIR